MNLTYYAPLSSEGLGAWRRTTDYPTGIQDESCIANSSYIYCVGGYVGAPNGSSSADVYYASLSSSGIGKWSQTTPFPYPISDPRCVTSAGYLYCIDRTINGTGSNCGGVYLQCPSLTDATYFTPLSSAGVGAWVQADGPPTLTAGCSAIGGYVYCYGGGNCSPLPFGDCYSPSYYAPLSSSGIGTWKNTSEIPTAGWAVYVTAGSYIYYMSVPIFFAQASDDGIGTWQTTTNYPNSLNPASCSSEGSLLYCLSAQANSSYYAQVGATNPKALQLENPPPFPRAEYLAPAWNGQGGCSVDGMGAPCFDQNIDDAVVFNCASAAETSSGCKTTVVSPLNTRYNYNMTIWYPYTNESLPDVNCRLLPVTGYALPIGPPEYMYTWCISTGQNSFIIAQQIEMHS
jgi:hypothetical protein